LNITMMAGQVGPLKDFTRKGLHMKLEDITTETIQKSTDTEISAMLNRAEQLHNASTAWQRALVDGKVSSDGTLSKEQLYKATEVLLDEADSRKIAPPASNIYKEITRRRATGLDITKAAPITIMKGVVHITGPCVTDPKNADVFSVHINPDVFGEPEAIQIAKSLSPISESPIGLADAAEGASIPLYDLVLVPRTQLEEVVLEKQLEPETDESLVLNLEKSNRDNIKFVKNMEKRLVGGIVYAPNEVDGQGHFMDNEEEIFKGMESWMVKGHPIKLMHNNLTTDVSVVEVFQPEQDTPKEGGIIPKGAWYLSCKVHDDKTWEAVKAGEIDGFSMAGGCLGEELETIS